jgi:hypothetical protein
MAVTSAITTIAEHKVICDNLYKNAEWRKTEDRVLARISYIVRIQRSVSGKYRVSVVPEFIHMVCDMSGPYRSVLFDTESEARADANRVWAFAKNVWVGNSFSDNDRTKTHFAGNDWNATTCTKCGEFDTLSTKHLSYGDETSCSNCDYSRYYSIGD